MLLAFCLIGIAQIVTIIGACLYLRRVLEHKQAEVEDKLTASLRSWIEPQGEGKLSKLAELMDLGGTVIGAAAAREIMMSLNADKGHALKAGNQIADGLEASANPLLGMLRGGKRGKGAALARLAEMLGPMLASQFNAGGNGNKPSVADRIAKGG
jgi:hypothetical protein